MGCPRSADSKAGQEQAPVVDRRGPGAGCTLGWALSSRAVLHVRFCARGCHLCDPVCMGVCVCCVEPQ